MHVKGIDSRLDLTRFTTRKIKSISFTYMEYLDLDISYGNGILGLITFYRPPRYYATPATFFREYSTLLKTLTTASGYLPLNGDFDIHIDVDTDTDANNFKTLLESTGLAPATCERPHSSQRTHP